jgi:hypothetical protein
MLGVCDIHQEAEEISWSDEGACPWKQHHCPLSY